MLNTFGNILVILTTVVASLLLMVCLDRIWPREKRRVHNDLIGWQLGILGTAYAVIMGFMLFTVWTNFGAADLNADAEANALLNVFRLADALPPEEGVALRRFAQSYADSVINVEWPAMAEGRTDFNLNPQNRGMWGTLVAASNVPGLSSTAVSQALLELSDLNQHRRIRQLQAISQLPGILWWVLLSGGAITISSSCLFGAGSRVLHILQVGALSLLIGSVLAAIADIDRPFQGAVHVEDTAFRRAQQTMSQYR